jgi:thioredoxin-related protein
MKRVLFVMLAIVAISSAINVDAKGKEKKKTDPKKAETAATPTPEPIDDSTEIHWISIDELQAKMRQAPRKVYIDMYTDWCGWCKKMDATTFQNQNVIKYMNEKYYCVKFNAERKDTIRFMGKYYYFDPNVRASTLASEWVQGKQLSYPTAVFMEEFFRNPVPVPGYQDVKLMEMILKYFGENIYKNKKWEDYQKDFIQYW